MNELPKLHISHQLLRQLSVRREMLVQQGPNSIFGPFVSQVVIPTYRRWRSTQEVLFAELMNLFFFLFRILKIHSLMSKALAPFYYSLR